MITQYANSFSKVHINSELINQVAGVLFTHAQATSSTTATGIALTHEALVDLQATFGIDNAQRLLNYKYFDHLDTNYAMCSAALDLHADDAVQVDYSKGRPFWIECEDEVIVGLAEELLYETLELDKIDKSWATIRDYCKYGDVFEEVILDKELGVVGIQALPPESMYIYPNSKLDVIKYVQRPSLFLGYGPTANEIPFQPWQVSHLRVPGKNRYDLYGRSILSDATRALKMLEAAETSLLMQRLTKGTDKYVFTIPVDGIPAAKQQTEVEKVASLFRRKKLLDTAKGEFKSVVNAIGNTQDYFIPSANGKKIEIDLLPQTDIQKHIDDIEYFKKKAIEALKVPAQYLNYLETTEMLKGPANSDIRWARKIRRIQNIYRDHIIKILDIHLQYILKQMPPAYTVVFASVSALEEQQRLEALEIKASVAAALQDYYSQKTILQEIFKLTEEEADKVLGQLDKQKIDATAVDSIAQANAEKLARDYFEPTGGEEDIATVDDGTPETMALPVGTATTDPTAAPATESKSKDQIIELYRQNLATNKRLREAVESMHSIQKELRTLNKKKE